MLYEIHMIKNYPPVNLNRDDTGSPKTCYFGGVQRGRISSQCLKRSWRISPLYDELLGSKGIRTRKLGDLLRAELERRGCEPDFIEAAAKKATGLANNDGKENSDESKMQIIFYSDEDVKAVADKMTELYEQSGSVTAFSKMNAKTIASSFKEVKTRPITLDIALFGRMVTSDVFRNVEASMQVAHAISTHAVNQESDYFTAVDDLLENSDETGRLQFLLLLSLRGDRYGYSVSESGNRSRQRQHHERTASRYHTDHGFHQSERQTKHLCGAYSPFADLCGSQEQKNPCQLCQRLCKTRQFPQQRPCRGKLPKTDGGNRQAGQGVCHSL